MEKVEHVYGDRECQCLSSIQHWYMTSGEVSVLHRFVVYSS